MMVFLDCLATLCALGPVESRSGLVEFILGGILHDLADHASDWAYTVASVATELFHSLNWIKLKILHAPERA